MKVLSLLSLFALSATISTQVLAEPGQDYSKTQTIKVKKSMYRDPSTCKRIAETANAFSNGDVILNLGCDYKTTLSLGVAGVGSEFLYVPVPTFTKKSMHLLGEINIVSSKRVIELESVTFSDNFDCRRALDSLNLLKVEGASIVAKCNDTEMTAKLFVQK